MSEGRRGFLGAMVAVAGVATALSAKSVKADGLQSPDESVLNPGDPAYLFIWADLLQPSGGVIDRERVVPIILGPMDQQTAVTRARKIAVKGVLTKVTGDPGTGGRQPLVPSVMIPPHRIRMIEFRATPERYWL